MTTEQMQVVFDEMDKFRLLNPWYDKAFEIVQKVDEIQRIYDEAVAATRPRYVSYSAGSTAPLTQDQIELLTGRNLAAPAADGAGE